MKPTATSMMTKTREHIRYYEAKMLTKALKCKLTP